MILFVIQRGDAERFMPMWDRDPDLGAALVEANDSGVSIYAIKMDVAPDSFTYLGEVPVILIPPDTAT